MKKLLLLVGLIVFSGKVIAVDEIKFERDRQKGGYYDGDPNKNEILEATENYIVIRNVTAKSQVYSPEIGSYELTEVFYLEARSHCAKNNFFNWLPDERTKRALDNHTIYLWCDRDLGSVLEEIYNLSEEERLIAAMFGVCALHWGNYSKEYKEYNCDKRINEGLKKWPKAKEIIDKIRVHRTKFGDPNFIFELKKRIFSNKGNEQIGGNDDSTIIAASSGTGFFITNKGHIVTNNHVIDSCNEVKAYYNNNANATTLVASDLVNDLALLKTNINPIDIFPIAKKDIGLLEEVFVAGFPFGKAISSSIKVTKGVVSSLTGIGDNYSNVQVDAALQPGNSGGPIVDESGNVVAVAVSKLDFAMAIELFDAIPENTNFGIKSSVLQIFLKANNVILTPPSNTKLATKDISKRITNATVYLDCWMTQAKINELRSSKAMFENLK